MAEGVQLQVIPETQNNSQSIADDDDNSQSLLIPSGSSLQSSIPAVTTHSSSSVLTNSDSGKNNGSADAVLNRACSLLQTTSRVPRPNSTVTSTTSLSVVQSTGTNVTGLSTVHTTVAPIPASSSMVFVGENSKSTIPTFTSNVKKGKADYLSDHLLDIENAGE